MNVYYYSATFYNSLTSNITEHFFTQFLIYLVFTWEYELAICMFPEILLQILQELSFILNANLVLDLDICHPPFNTVYSFLY